MVVAPSNIERSKAVHLPCLRRSPAKRPQRRARPVAAARIAMATRVFEGLNRQVAKSAKNAKGFLF